MNVSYLISNVFSALIVFELFFLQLVLGHHPVTSSHLAIFPLRLLTKCRFFCTSLCIVHYYMALACGRYNVRFDWLIVTEL